MTQIQQTLRIALVQENPVLGAIDANLELAKAAYHDAVKAKADLVVFTELFISGYPRKI